MFDVIPTLSQRFGRMRAKGRVARGAHATATGSQRRTSLGETMAIGLGCDSWKRQA